MKILISDKTAPICAEMLRSAGHEVDENTGLSADQLKEIIGDYDGLVVRSATKVTADILGAADNLKVIGRAGTGVDNIDTGFAASRNIVVMNAPGGNSNAVAEIVLGQMLGLARTLHDACASIKSGKWEKKAFSGTELFGKTLGILGYGRVSRLLAHKCLALGMKVLCYDPKIGKDIIDETGVEICSRLVHVLQAADYISVHLTKRENTINFIGAAEFSQMKKGVYLLNYARGGIVNEAELQSAFDEGIVAGAALDVFDIEPPEEFNLIRHPKVVCTPHIGAASQESQDNVARIIAEQFIDMFAGGKIRNQVN